MKKTLFAFGILLMAAPAHADITHKISSSVQLTVDAAASQATRIGSTYAISGSNVTINTEGGLGTSVSGSAPGYTATDWSAPASGDWSFNQSFTAGDSVSSGTAVTSGVVGTLPAFGNVTTTAGGVAGSLAGTIDNTHTMSLTAGGSGTSATGQFVSEITIK